MSLYSHIARSQAGSSALFGFALFAAMLPTDGIAGAATAGLIGASAWFGLVPVIRHFSGGARGA